MTESGKRQEVITLYPNGNGSKIPFHSRIGTKLIVGFLIIASITGSLGYLGLNYAQSVGEKFHLLEQDPDEIDLKESIRNAANAFFQTSNKLVELRQSALASAPTLSPSAALDALIIEKETAENVLFKAIDSAIANEIDEIQERSKAVDAAIIVLLW
ncbi:MAG TPA: hypothetical protein VK462_08915 [Nitrososphaeraceae archaeon]|nr:hypothetical protein [Nitrososphaeraceae archaeon]